MRKETILGIFLCILILLLSGCTEQTADETSNIKDKITDLKNIIYQEKDFLTATATYLDFSEMVHYDGSVGKIEENNITTYPPFIVEQTIFIKNRYNEMNDNKTRDIYISLQNPQKGKNREQGLHDNLETSRLKIYIEHPWLGEFYFYCPNCAEPSDLNENMWIDSRWYYNGNMYHLTKDKVKLLTPDAEVRFEIKFKLYSAYSGTFQDGQTYTCRYWLIDINYNQIQEITFEVRT